MVLFQDHVFVISQAMAAPIMLLCLKASLNPATKSGYVPRVIVPVASMAFSQKVAVMSTVTSITDTFMPTYSQGFFWSRTKTWHI